MANIRQLARRKVRDLIGAHRHEYIATGCVASRINISMSGFETYLLVDGVRIWKISVKNKPQKNAPDLVWVEDEYIGPSFHVKLRDQSLFEFLPEGTDGIAKHY